MALAPSRSDDDELTPEQTREELEKLTDRYLGMSLDEFYRRADTGRLPDHPAVPHLILMSGARASSC